MNSRPLVFAGWGCRSMRFAVLIGLLQVLSFFFFLLSFILPLVPVETNTELFLLFSPSLFSKDTCIDQRPTGIFSLFLSLFFSRSLCLWMNLPHNYNVIARLRLPCQRLWLWWQIWRRLQNASVDGLSESHNWVNELHALICRSLIWVAWGMTTIGF